ncbi:unnamed protein product, partial [Meganyctiphanes norvegica]
MHISLKLAIVVDYICENSKNTQKTILDCHPGACLGMSPPKFFSFLASFGSMWDICVLRPKKLRQQLQLKNFRPWDFRIFASFFRKCPKSDTNGLGCMSGNVTYLKDPQAFQLGEKLLREISCKCLETIKIGVNVVQQVAREVLDEGVAAAAVGVTTDEIDRIIHEAAVERECYPSPLNYHGFPKSCCTSINEVICHGIPDNRPLVNGDICNNIPQYERHFWSAISESRELWCGEVLTAVICNASHAHLQRYISITKMCFSYKNIRLTLDKHGRYRTLHFFTCRPLSREVSSSTRNDDAEKSGAEGVKAGVYIFPKDPPRGGGGNKNDFRREFV